MTYYSEVAAIAGLDLEPDTSPYTGTTLGPNSIVADGNWDISYDATSPTPGLWEPSYSFGIDLGSSLEVDRLMMVINKGYSSSGGGAWRSPTSKFANFSVYSSDDNSVWSFVQNFIGPPWTWKGANNSAFYFVFSSARTARYFKVVNVGSGRVHVGDQSCRPGQIIAYKENAGRDPNIRVGAAVALGLDPDNTHANIALSNNNLTATMTARARNCARASSPLPSTGKWYWEVTLLNSYGTSAESSQRTNIGIGTANASLSKSLGYDAESWAVSAAGLLFHDSVYPFSGPGRLMSFSLYAATYHHVIGVAYDADSGKLFFRWHIWGGRWGLGDPEAGTNAAFSGITGTVYPMISLSYPDDQMIINFGASDFAYPVPSGFYPLQEPITESVVITSPPNVRELISRIAYEASSVEYWDAGSHNIIYLPTHTTVSKTIDANRIDVGSVNVEYTDRVDLLNSLTLWFNYYWSGYSDDDAFGGTVRDKDAASIDKYGTLEQEPFQFKYLEGFQNPGRALSWLLNEFKNPRLIVSFVGGHYLTDIRRGSLINFNFTDGDVLDAAFSGLVSTSDKFMVLNISRDVSYMTIKAVQLIAV